MDIHGPVTDQLLQHCRVHPKKPAEVELGVADVPAGILVGFSNVAEEPINYVACGGFPSSLGSFFAVHLDALFDFGQWHKGKSKAQMIRRREWYRIGRVAG